MSRPDNVITSSAKGTSGKGALPGPSDSVKYLRPQLIKECNRITRTFLCTSGKDFLKNPNHFLISNLDYRPGSKIKVKICHDMYFFSGCK